MRKKKMPPFRIRTSLHNHLLLTPAATLLSERNVDLKNLGIPCTSLYNGGDQTQLLLITPSHAKSGLLTMRQGRWWCSSAQPCFICCKIQELGHPAGLHGEEQEVKDPKTSIRFGLLHPLDFWPLPSGEKQVGNQVMPSGTHGIL